MNNQYPATEWMVDGSLVYRLDQDGVNYEEINVSMTGGSHDRIKRYLMAKDLAEYLNGLEG